MEKLYRARNSKMVTGLCKGIADYFNISVLIVRIAVVVIAFPHPFITALIYGVASYLVPVQKQTIFPSEPEEKSDFFINPKRK